MSVSETTAGMRVHRIPAGWRVGESAGEFVATALPRGEESAVVSVLPAESPNPDYLLARYGAKIAGPLGRPMVQSLPHLLADGVSIVASDEGRDGLLYARIDLVRRAWDLDIVVSARQVAVENTELLFSDMLDLLWEVQPEGTARPAGSDRQGPEGHSH